VISVVVGIICFGFFFTVLGFLLFVIFGKVHFTTIIIPDFFWN
jgi:hypothetical protein